MGTLCSSHSHPACVICIGNTPRDWILNQVWIPNCCLKWLPKSFTRTQPFNKKMVQMKQTALVTVQSWDDSPRHHTFGFISGKVLLNYKINRHWSIGLHKSRSCVCLGSSSYVQVLKMCQVVFWAWGMPWYFVARLSLLISHNNFIKHMLFAAHSLCHFDLLLPPWFFFPKIRGRGFRWKRRRVVHPQPHGSREKLAGLFWALVLIVLWCGRPILHS